MPSIPIDVLSVARGTYTALPFGAYGAVTIVGTAPECLTASAAVFVPVGKIDDPSDLPGLSHLLEHLMYLRGPHDWAGRRGGHFSAYEDWDCIVFSFTVAADAFEETLDRCIAALDDPTPFDPVAVAHEIDVIEAEFRLDAENEGKRFLSLMRATANPQHPFARPAGGSAATLRTVPGQAGVDVVARLNAHRRRFLGAATRRLVVHLPNDARAAFVAAVARGRWGPAMRSDVAWQRTIRPGHRTAAPRRQSVFTERELGFWFDASTPTPMRGLGAIEPVRLTVVFPVAANHAAFGTTTACLCVGNLLCDPLEERLRADGFDRSVVTTETIPVDFDEFLFTVTAELNCPEVKPGAVEAVVAAVFDQLAALHRGHRGDPATAAEVHARLVAARAAAEPPPPVLRCETIARSVVLDGPWDPVSFQTLLMCLHPDNANVYLRTRCKRWPPSSHCGAPCTSPTETTTMGVAFRRRRIPVAVLDRWSSANAAVPVQRKPSDPRVAAGTAAVALPERRWTTCVAGERLKVHFRECAMTATHGHCMLREDRATSRVQRDDTTRIAAVVRATHGHALIDFELYTVDDKDGPVGWQAYATGPSDAVFGALAGFIALGVTHTGADDCDGGDPAAAVAPDAFTEADDPWRDAVAISDGVLLDRLRRKPPPHLCTPPLAPTPADTFRVTGLFVGPLRSADASSFIRTVTALLVSGSDSGTDIHDAPYDNQSAVVDRAVTRSVPPGVEWIVPVAAPTVVIRSFVVLGPSDPPTRAAAAVLAALLDGEARTKLRTEETLGYVTSVEAFEPSTLDPDMGVTGLLCTVVPSRDRHRPLWVLVRIADFWTHAPGRCVAACDATELRRIVTAIVATRGPAAAPTEKVAAQRMWKDLMRSDPDGSAEIRALLALTPRGLCALVDRRLSDPSRRQRITVTASPSERESVTLSPDPRRYH